VDLPGAAKADQRDAGERGPPMRRHAPRPEHPWPADLAWRGFPQEIAITCHPARDRPTESVFEMRAHRVGDARNSTIETLPLPAFELPYSVRKCRRLLRAPFATCAKRPHGADALPELFEKAGLGSESSLMSL